MEVAQVHRGHQSSIQHMIPLDPGYSEYTEIFLSPYGEFIAIWLSYHAPVLVTSLTGKRLTTLKCGQASCPLWHPEEPVLAAVCRGHVQLILFPNTQTRLLTRVLGDAGRAHVHCWSPCGALLCYGAPREDDSPDEETLTIVRVSDGSVASTLPGLKISNRQTVLACAEMGRLVLKHGISLEVLDLASGAVLFRAGTVSHASFSWDGSGDGGEGNSTAESWQRRLPQRVPDGNRVLC